MGVRDKSQVLEATVTAIPQVTITTCMKRITESLTFPFLGGSRKFDKSTNY